MTEIVCREGPEAATVARVTATAHVSRPTFYRLFANCDECLLAAFDCAVAQAAAPMRCAYEACEHWLDGVRAGLLELLLFLDRDHDLARFCVVHSLRGDRAMLARRARVLADLVAVIDAGRRPVDREHDLPSFAAEGVVGAVLSILYARLLEPTGEPLVGLWGCLMSVVALPYRGPAVARRELELRPPRTSPAPSPAAGSASAHALLQRYGLRVTYRTIRVLGAVAERPGSTSREVGSAAGIRDPGQISKLLWRLHRLGLVENVRAGEPKEAPKAWRLTREGAAVNAAMRDLAR